MCHGGCVKTEDRAKLHCSVTVTPTGCPLVSTLHVLSFVLGNNVNLLQLGSERIAPWKRLGAVDLHWSVFCCDDCGGVEPPELFSGTVHYCTQAQTSLYLRNVTFNAKRRISRVTLGDPAQSVSAASSCPVTCLESKQNDVRVYVGGTGPACSPFTALITVQ